MTCGLTTQKYDKKYVEGRKTQQHLLVFESPGPSRQASAELVMTVIVSIVVIADRGDYCGDHRGHNYRSRSRPRS